MIKELFSRKISSITIAAFLVAFSSLVSRFLGIFRDRILAGEFGVGPTLDIYYAAFRIPDLIFNLLVLGALSAGFIPVLSSLIQNKIFAGGYQANPKAWEFTNNLLNILALSLLVISGLGMVFAPFLMKLVVPGFPLEQRELAMQLTRIMFLSPIFLGISAVLGGILQSFKRFFVYSLAPIMYNIGIIIGALYFVPWWGIYGLAWGVVLGALMHLAVQVPITVKLGFKYRPILNFHDKNIKEVGAMMVPRALSLAVSQINLLVITIIASTLAVGSLTVFNFANNLQSFPVGIFGISFAIAAFPTLAAYGNDKKELIHHFSQTVRHILFFIVPATVLLITLRAQIIRVIYGAGKFDWQATILTMDTLGFFSISLFAQGLIPLLARMFYSRHNSRTPFWIGLVTAVANIFFSWYLASRMGVAGLALAFSLASILNFFLLWLALHGEIKFLDEKNILFSVIKFSAAAVACGITVQGVKLLVWPYVDMDKFWGVFTQGFAAGVSGIFIYLAVCSLLKSEELSHFVGALRRRLPWKKVQAGDQGEARGI